MRYCSYPPSTPSSLHELLFIHHRPPPASTCDCSSTGSCSSSLHHALIHRLLFNHPSTIYYSSSPPHHRVLFNHPSTGTPPLSTVHPALHTTGSCSTTPPRAPLHRLLFIQPSTTPRGPVHPEATPRGPVHPPPPGTVHPNPPQRSLFIQRQHRSASVSSSSEGIARSGSVNSHRSIARVQYRVACSAIARVQLEPNASLGFS